MLALCALWRVLDTNMLVLVIRKSRVGGLNLHKPVMLTHACSGGIQGYYFQTKQKNEVSHIEVHISSNTAILMLGG